MSVARGTISRAGALEAVGAALSATNTAELALRETADEATSVLVSVAHFKVAEARGALEEAHTDLSAADAHTETSPQNTAPVNGKSQVNGNLARPPPTIHSSHTINVPASIPHSFPLPPTPTSRGGTGWRR